MTIEIGLERFAAEQSAARTVRGRVGLLLNRASVDAKLRLASERIGEALPGSLVSIFTPQHGWWGEQQANMVETPHQHASLFDAPVYSLYSQSRRPSAEMLEPIDYLIVDLQDVGVRVYTFIWTMLYCLEACADAGVEVIVLDRPNPLGGKVVEGPLLKTQYRSFVGEAETPMRHALTIGEMARWLAASKRIDVRLTVAPMRGWTRPMMFSELHRTWIPPSPNLPVFDSALVYPGQVLLEGVNLSEGRGTTRPFEVVGAPFIDPVSFAAACEQLELPGVRFLPARFTPTFDKWEGESCGGISIHVTDPQAFRSYRMTISLMKLCAERYPSEFRWNEPPYEYEYDLAPIDIISGGDQIRTQLTSAPVDELDFVDIEAWNQATADARIYND